MAATQASGSGSGGGWLDSILNSGSTLFSAWKASDAADANKAAEKATAKAATAQSASWVKIAMIGGGALIVVVVLATVLRRGK